jgi:alkylhydroperoxidase/carboxymuconolactone decarboxylase family protein YurZ
MLEREYVYAEPVISITDLAEKYDLARSGVADKARIGKWYEKREAFRAKVADKVTDAMAERWAEMQTTVYERLVQVGLAHLDLHEQALKDGKISSSTRDMIAVASMLSSILKELAQKPMGVADPRQVGGEEFNGTDEEARSTIEYVRRLMAGGSDAGTDKPDA